MKPALSSLAGPPYPPYPGQESLSPLAATDATTGAFVPLALKRHLEDRAVISQVPHPKMELPCTVARGLLLSEYI